MQSYKEKRYKQKKEQQFSLLLFFTVGIPGFEPGTPCSQSRCANRTALHPESLALAPFQEFAVETSLISGCKDKGLFVIFQIF